MSRAKLKVVGDGAMALLTDIAPGTASLVAATGGSASVDLPLALGEIWRANAIVDAYVNSLSDDRADDRYVLWTVQAILRDAISIIEAT